MVIAALILLVGMLLDGAMNLISIVIENDLAGVIGLLD
jgi:hypothetical protein